MVMGETPVMNMRSKPPPLSPGSGLERGKEIAIEAAAMGEGLIGFGPAIAPASVLAKLSYSSMSTYSGMPLSPAYRNNSLSWPLTESWGADVLTRRLGKQIRIALQRVSDHHLAILFKA